MRVPDNLVERALGVVALSSILALFAITFFVFKEGIPLMQR